MVSKRLAVVSVVIPVLVPVVFGLFWLSALLSIIGLAVVVIRSPHPKAHAVRRQKWLVYPLLFLGVFVLAIIFKTLVLCLYKIPSGSMERTISIGDVVWVNKFNYGPKLPKNPYEVPWFNVLYWALHKGDTTHVMPSWAYRRLSGFGAMQRGDVVVFEHPDNGEIYIKRCVALPGDTFCVAKGQIANNGTALPFPPKALVYAVVGFNANGGANAAGKRAIAAMDFTEVLPDTAGEGFSAKMTHEQMVGLRDNPSVVEANIDAGRFIPYWTVYPHRESLKWNWNNIGPFYIPRKGAIIELNELTFELYGSTITKHEKCNIEPSPQGFLVNGKRATHYTFLNDYCYVMGDNRHDSMDSRYFGLLPVSNVIGKACFVVYSANGLVFPPQPL
jgi:signal peptidase I